MTQTIAADNAAQVDRPALDFAEINRRRPALPSLTGARWWAACFAYVLHALVFLPVYPFDYTQLFRDMNFFVPMGLGACAVSFFFVLSGFIIYWSFRPGNDFAGYLRGYYRRRVLKIYPSAFIGFGAFALAAWHIPWHKVYVWLPNLFLVHAWTPATTLVGGMNVPSWSLCAEVMFYATFPLWYFALRKIPTNRLILALVVVFLLIMALHTSYYLFAEGPKYIHNDFAPRLRLPSNVTPYFEPHADPRWFNADPHQLQPPLSYWLSYTFPLTRLPEFWFGILAARLVLEGRWKYTRMWPPLLFLALSFVATYFTPVNWKMGALVLVPTTMVIATMAMRDLNGIKGITVSKPLIWLGNISFAFYLIQYPVMVAMTRFVTGGHSYGSVWWWLFFMLLCWAISIGLAGMIYHWVDLPIMNNFAKSKKKKPAKVDAVAA